MTSQRLGAQVVDMWLRRPHLAGLSSQGPFGCILIARGQRTRVLVERGPSDRVLITQWPCVRVLIARRPRDCVLVMTRAVRPCPRPRRGTGLCGRVLVALRGCVAASSSRCAVSSRGVAFVGSGPGLLLRRGVAAGLCSHVVAVAYPGVLGRVAVGAVWKCRRWGAGWCGRVVGRRRGAGVVWVRRLSSGRGGGVGAPPSMHGGCVGTSFVVVAQAAWARPRGGAGSGSQSRSGGVWLRCPACMWGTELRLLACVFSRSNATGVGG